MNVKIKKYRNHELRNIKFQNKINIDVSEMTVGQLRTTILNKVYKENNLSTNSTVNLMFSYDGLENEVFDDIINNMPLHIINNEVHIYYSLDEIKIKDIPENITSKYLSTAYLMDGGVGGWFDVDILDVIKKNFPYIINALSLISSTLTISEFSRKIYLKYGTKVTENNIKLTVEKRTKGYDSNDKAKEEIKKMVFECVSSNDRNIDNIITSFFKEL